MTNRHTLPPYGQELRITIKPKQDQLDPTLIVEHGTRYPLQDTPGPRGFCVALHVSASGVAAAAETITPDHADALAAVCELLTAFFERIQAEGQRAANAKFIQTATDRKLKTDERLKTDEQNAGLTESLS